MYINKRECVYQHRRESVVVIRDSVCQFQGSCSLIQYPKSFEDSLPFCSHKPITHCSNPYQLQERGKNSCFGLNAKL